MRTLVLLVGGVALSVLALGCEKKCEQVLTNVSPNEAHYAWSRCSDEQDRTIDCKRSGEGHDCTCILGGTPGKTFRVPMPGGAWHSHMITAESAQEHCGWQDIALTKF